ncbi:MAG: cytochrome c biogenesis heme-transporting ATPase CcmA [Gammaproteobacteria bacterium]|nr:cytochrome c biogenesis heme-transporting ATPase CcmA [Gammaproteobacteria bacterium]
MLETAQLQCIRGDRMLFRDLSFSVNEREMLYVRGENGSGKTSLLRILCGLMVPAEGEIRWNGENVKKLGEEYNKDLLYLGHKLGTKADMTAVENLRVSSSLAGHPISEDEAWDALAEIGLKGREDLPVKVLSQGQQRRVALSRLLVSKAKLWILDEPFTALDVKAVAQLQDILAAHLDKNGMIIITTHQDFQVSSGTQRELSMDGRGGGMH